ncbi:MAG: hypothetical protein Q4F32_10255, partial [Eubacteriales bacterium]|nr:hypothetical protein [Eubacteriales bacterium]
AEQQQKVYYFIIVCILTQPRRICKMTISTAAAFCVFMQVAKQFMLYIHFSLIVRKAGAAAVCQLPHLSGYTK